MSGMIYDIYNSLWGYYVGYLGDNHDNMDSKREKYSPTELVQHSSMTIDIYV